MGVTGRSLRRGEEMGAEPPGAFISIQSLEFQFCFVSSSLG